MINYARNDKVRFFPRPVSRFERCRSRLEHGKIEKATCSWFNTARPSIDESCQNIIKHKFNGTVILCINQFFVNLFQVDLLFSSFTDQTKEIFFFSMEIIFMFSVYVQLLDSENDHKALCYLRESTTSSSRLTTFEI